jgi:peptide/nickel transport system ATP-binding protein
MSQTKLPLLSLEDVSIAFRSGNQVKTAVKKIEFQVYAGKTLGIVGESGSGKSVSSLTIMQLLQKDKAFFPTGKILLHPALYNQWDPTLQPLADGRYAVSPSHHVFAHLRGRAIAMIFQEPMTALNPVMKCGEQIIEMILLHLQMSRPEARAKTLELFQKVKLPVPESMLDRYPHELSGGQRQRVMIAMALSCQPQLIIADEPTTALDVTVQKEILLLLKDLQKELGMAMIFITHDLGVVRLMADDVLVMRHGEMIEQGPAHEILDHPKEKYTQALLACRPQWGVKLNRLPTIQAMEDAGSSHESPTSFSSKEVLIDVQKMSKVYAKATGIFGQNKTSFHALDQVSFQIFKGETLGLVGESGCGKTTLSRVLLGLIPATSGMAIYQGEDMLQGTASQWNQWRKDLQIIFQDPYSALNPKLTIGEAIIEPMVLRHFGDSAAQRQTMMWDLLDKVGLPKEAAQRYPHEFSGGQRQRVVIARALATQPQFIICDESVSALDVSVQAQVLNLLNDLKKELGLTYLFISHDLRVVYQMCDRIMVMQRGKMEELNTANDIFFNPQSAYTRRLLDAAK